ncbi:MAG: type II secretion system protein [Mycoplasmatota bacterium]
MKKGFTLIEMLGVIIILALITLVVFPTIMNNIDTSRDTIDTVTESLIETAATVYIRENADDFDLNEGDRYCITLQELVNANLLDSPLLDSNQEEIDLSKHVQVDIVDGFLEQLIINDCEEIITN